MASSTLLLSTKKEEDAADTLLAALTTIAHASPVEESKPKKTRRSRFFYRPSVSFQEDIDERKQISKPVPVDLVDQEVQERLNTYKTELPTKLTANIDRVREFFLKEIAPLTLAGQSGAGQARDVVQRLLNAEIDGTPFAQYDRMLAIATTIKMAREITKYMGLPAAMAENLLDSIQPKKEVAFMMPPPPEERRGPVANATKSENLKEEKPKE